jgi:hypothetical protein
MPMNHEKFARPESAGSIAEETAITAAKMSAITALRLTPCRYQ